MPSCIRNNEFTMRKKAQQLFYAFPVQLLMLHLRSNLLLLGMWILLILAIGGAVGSKFGVRYLFLDPEYLREVNFWGFWFIGLAFGCFYLTWNLTVYLLSAHFFPFLATLKNPFTKFCLNNFLLPLGFLVFYLLSLIFFRAYFVSATTASILTACLGFLLGMAVTLFLYIVYFHYTNVDIHYYEKRKVVPPDFIAEIPPGHRSVDLEFIKQDKNRWRVDTYLTEALQVRLVRSVAHYDSSLLKRIFRQNHLNALVMQMTTILVLMLLGLLIDHRLFIIPAGASFLFLLSIFMALIGAISYWFNRWRNTLLILLLVLVNMATSNDVARHKSKAFGLSYSGAAPYSYPVLDSICSPEKVLEDRRQTIRILEQWKEKAGSHPAKKPKMVLLCVSGGGLRSALWTMRVIQDADRQLKGGLLDQTVLITGASGGMLGAAYLRELKLRQTQGIPVDLYSTEHRRIITKDLLNPIAFTLVTNDLILPWTTFEVGDEIFRKDRGYSFERQFNENTGFILDKALADYRLPEQRASIPMMYITPTIVNDVRRLVISPQGVSFMMVTPIGVEHKGKMETDAVDFRAVFAGQSADSLRFLSALRMSASYPYILPSVYLPSEPAIEVMDAGFRDNYGMLSATRFVQVFADWIKANTSGVVLVQITTSEKVEEIRASDRKGIFTSLLNPLEIAGQIMSLQELEQDNALGFIYDILGKDHVDFIRFMYHPGENKKLRASISFHITAKERELVEAAIREPDNQQAMQQLLDVLGK